MASAQQTNGRNTRVLGDIFNVGGTEVDQTVAWWNSHFQSISPADVYVALPLLISDNGTSMASIAQVGKGRAVGYGFDVLSEIVRGGMPQHAPLFKRVFTWALTGNATGSLPASIKYAVSDMSSAHVKTYLQTLGRQGVDIGCNVGLPNTCWQNADVIFFRQYTAGSADLQAQVRAYLEAGKTVMYFASSHNPGQWNAGVLAAMGMKDAGSTGLYWTDAPSWTVSAGRTAQQTIATGLPYTALLSALDHLDRGTAPATLSATTQPVLALDSVGAQIKAQEEAGNAIFGATANPLLGLLTLWADVTRSGQDYGATVPDAATLLRLYAADSFRAYARASTTASKAGGFGLLPESARALTPSTDWETLDVVLNQAKGSQNNFGYTLLGRGALPAQGVELEVLENPSGATLRLQTGRMRFWPSPQLTPGGKYSPKFPASSSIPVKAGINPFATPFGGPLVFAFNTTQPGATVKIRIKGVVKYAHVDTLQPMNPAELANAEAQFKDNKFGWVTMKMRGGEAQNASWRSIAEANGPGGLLQAAKNFQAAVIDVNHHVQGTTNLPASEGVTAECARQGWDCTSETLHPAFRTQVFVAAYANCGYMCSGNVIDSGQGINTTWGWPHELGHNTVQGWMSIKPGANGCTTECNNNIYAAASMFKRVELGIATGGSPYAGWSQSFYNNFLVVNRALGLSGEAQRADMQARLWDSGPSNATSGPMLVLQFQLAFMYARDRLGLAKPTVQSTIDYLALMSKGTHLVYGGAFSTATAAKYGMSRYLSNSISQLELNYVLGSKLVGRDLREVFTLYGLPLSQTALDSVADLQLPLAPLSYFAMKPNSADLASGVWLSLPAQGAIPLYPL